MRIKLIMESDGDDLRIEDSVKAFVIIKLAHLTSCGKIKHDRIEFKGALFHMARKYYDEFYHTLDTTNMFISIKNNKADINKCMGELRLFLTEKQILSYNAMIDELFTKFFNCASPSFEDNIHSEVKLIDSLAFAIAITILSNDTVSGFHKGTLTEVVTPTCQDHYEGIVPSPEISDINEESFIDILKAEFDRDIRMMFHSVTGDQLNTLNKMSDGIAVKGLHEVGGRLTLMLHCDKHGKDVLHSTVNAINASDHYNNVKAEIHVTHPPKGYDNDEIPYVGSFIIDSTVNGCDDKEFLEAIIKVMSEIDYQKDTMSTIDVSE